MRSLPFPHRTSLLQERVDSFQRVLRLHQLVQINILNSLQPLLQLPRVPAIGDRHRHVRLCGGQLEARLALGERGLLLLSFAALIGMFFTWRLTRAIERLRNYAQVISQGGKATVPTSSAIAAPNVSRSPNTPKVPIMPSSSPIIA